MKRLLTIFLFLPCLSLVTPRHFYTGTKYYISTSGTGSGNGLSTSTPWPPGQFRQTDATLCRSLAQSGVTAANNPKVYFCDLSTSYTFSDSSNYGDPGATVKHPNEQGVLGIFNVLSSFITLNNIQI